MECNKELEIYFDMDEVVVVLSEQIVKIYNQEHGTNKDWKLNNSYWWRDIDSNQKYFEELLTREGVFFNATPCEGMIECLNNLHNNGYKIYFLTMPDYENKTCYYEKLKWLQKYLEWFEPKMLIATESKHLLAKSNRVLCDDNEKYLKAWQQEGGMSIAFGNYSWSKNHKGLRVLNAKELECLINLIEEGK